MITEAAERRLQKWAEENSERDAEIVMARLFGLNKTRIHEITGLARTTIDRILNRMVEELDGKVPVLVLVDEDQEHRLHRLITKHGAVGEPFPNNEHPTWRVHDGFEFVNPHSVTSIAVKLANPNP